MKTTTFRFILGATAAFCLAAGTARGMCAGDENAAGEWIFEPVAESPSWALNSGADGDVGNLGLTGGAAFSSNVPPPNCDCGLSLFLPPEGGVAGAVSINDYDPLAGAEKFTVLAWVRRDSADGANLSARIFSDTDSTALTNTTAGVEFRFSGNAGTLALRVNGAEVATTVGGIAPTNGDWRHVAVVFDGTRVATNYATRNVHFYVDGIQRGVGSVLQNVVPATNAVPVVVGNASPSRTSQNLLAGHIDDVLVVPGWAPDAVGNGNANPAIQCFMDASDDIFPPVIAAPPDVEAEAGPCLAPVAVPLGSATASDDCGVALVTNDAPAVFEVGVTTVTWTAFDAAGNAATATQRVAVLPSRSADCDGDGWSDWEETMEWDADPFDRLDAPNGEVARGVLLHAVKYSAASADQWVQLHCGAPREVDLSGFRLQVAGTNWETKATFPAETRMRPGHFLLVGGAGVTNADLTADLGLAGSYPDQPTAGVRLMPPGDATNAPVDVLMYGSHVPFNEQGLDATGWRSTTTDLWASATRHLERWTLGSDTDRENDWRHTADGTDLENSKTILDTDGDGLPDEQEYSGNRNGGMPTDPLNMGSDGDGLRDGFEVRHGLDPLSMHGGGSSLCDNDKPNPVTGNTFGQDQIASGLNVSWNASAPNWAMGSSIGSNGWVHFSITASDGAAVWASIVEGGHTPEEFTYSVQDAIILYERAKNVCGFTHLDLLLQPTPDSGTCTIEVVDDSAGCGVVDPRQIGPDISGAFQAARLNISMPHTDETTEENPGEFIPSLAAHPTVRRIGLTIDACELYGFPGALRLTWPMDNVAIYDAPGGDVPLSNYLLPACGAESTTLYVEGTAIGVGNLCWQSVEVPELDDKIRVAVVKVYLAASPAVAVDGTSVDVDVLAEPASAQAHVDHVELTICKPDGSTEFDNPAHQGSTIELRGYNACEWRIPNMRWYSTQADHCNYLSEYKVHGHCLVGGTEVPLQYIYVLANTLPSTLVASTEPVNYWTGMVEISTTYNELHGMWEATVSPGTFRRDVQAAVTVAMPTTSQFYNMILAEETIHKRQLEGSHSSLLDGLWRAEDVMARLALEGPFRGTTKTNAEEKAYQAFCFWCKNFRDRGIWAIRDGSDLRCRMEAEAKRDAEITHRYSLGCTYPDCNVP